MLVKLMEMALNDYKKKSSKVLIEKVQALIDKLNKNEISLTDSKNIQPVLVFGRLNMSILLKQHIDPHLLLINESLSEQGNLHTALPECSTLDFTSQRFTDYCDNLLFISKDYANNIMLNHSINVTADLSLIRLILLSIQSATSMLSFKTCKLCFRRILVDKYCWLHKSGASDAYIKRKIHSKNENDELKIFIEKWKDKRKFLGELPNFLPDSFDSLDSISAQGIPAYGTSIRISNDIYKLIKSFSQPDWNKGKAALDLFIRKEVPALGNILKGQTDEVDSFNDYVRRVYSPNFLDNRYEISISDLWFFFTLLEANLHFNEMEKARKNYSLKVNQKFERDKKILELKKEGLSYRNIAIEVQVSKTTVEKVCKGISFQ